MAQARVKTKAETLDEKKARLKKIITILKKLYPDAKCSLDFETPFQLVVATVLSAQCTDVRVNKTTPDLFRHYPDAFSMAKAPLPAIEKLIQSTGFFRSKALSLSNLSKTLVEEHSGKVPGTMEELVKLRGVGRKTANVVLGNAFGVPGFPVDTHVGRLTRRLGLTKQADPVKVETEITKLAPPKEWTHLSHRLIYHGRAICDARNPKCEECALSALCPKIGVRF